MSLQLRSLADRELLVIAREDPLFAKHFLYTELVMRLTRSLSRDGSKSERTEVILVNPEVVT